VTAEIRSFKFAKADSHLCLLPRMEADSSIDEQHCGWL